MPMAACSRRSRLVRIRCQSANPLTGTLPLYSGSPPFVNTSRRLRQRATNQTVTVTAEQTVSLDEFDEGLDTAISYGGATA